MSPGKADVGRRALAYFFDAIIASLPSFILFPLPPLGQLLGTAYLLSRDVLLYELTRSESWRRKSIGKRLVNLEVVALDGERLTWEKSVKRNLPLALGPIALWMPPVLRELLTLAAAALILIEVVLVLSDSRGRRLGDQWAGTEVVVRD